MTGMADRQSRWSGIIGAGQSLSAGFDAPLQKPTSAAPFAYRLADVGNRFDITNPDREDLQLVPLTEPFRKLVSKNDWYPGNLKGKTPQHSMSLQIARMCLDAGLAPPNTVHTAVGKNGAPMWEINRGGTTNAYEASLFEARALTRLVKERHQARLEYSAIVLTHGETDAMLGHTTYAEELMQLQKSYAEDLQQVTGQAAAPILIVSQQHTIPWSPDSLPPQLMQDQWYAQRTSNNAIVCAGPKYQYHYHTPGGVHLNEAGYDRLGEKYGQVYFECIVRKTLWEPLRPTLIELTSAITIVVNFHVPVLPLQWDEALPAVHREGKHTHWANGRGFELRDATGQEIGIVEVHIAGEHAQQRNAVIIELATKDYKKPLMLAYAMTQDSDQAAGGEGYGRMGSLCDSDGVVSASRESKRCEFKHGSREVTCGQGWTGRDVWDTVHVNGLRGVGDYEDCIVGFAQEKGAGGDNSKTAMLHKPWPGADGWHDVRVDHNLRNYCVAFSMPVAWALGAPGERLAATPAEKSLG